MARKKQRKGRISEQGIDRRGLHICEKGGQIKPLTGQIWDVELQSGEGVPYRVSLGCGKATCVAYGREMVASTWPRSSTCCSKRPRHPPGGRSSERRDRSVPIAARKEHVLNGRDDSGRERCPRKLCNRRFGDNLGFGYRHMSPLLTTPALVLNGAGMSPLNIRIMLELMNVKVHMT